MLIKKSLNFLPKYQQVISKSYSIQIGSKASLSKVFTTDDIEQFAKLSLDFNELHLDENAAKKAGFEKQIVHGILVNGLVSAVLGTILPGKGSIFVSQKISFIKPVYANRKVTVEIEVTNIMEKMKKTFYECEFKGYVQNPTNQDLCIKGFAQLLKRDMS